MDQRAEHSRKNLVLGVVIGLALFFTAKSFLIQVVVPIAAILLSAPPSLEELEAMTEQERQSAIASMPIVRWGNFGSDAATNLATVFLAWLALTLSRLIGRRSVSCEVEQFEFHREPRSPEIEARH